MFQNHNKNQNNYAIDRHFKRDYYLYRYYRGGALVLQCSL